MAQPGLACTDMLLRQDSPLENGWEDSPDLSHRLCKVWGLPQDFNGMSKL
jgi:hypothetical protein